jgi:hypothetical protein
MNVNNYSNTLDSQHPICDVEFLDPVPSPGAISKVNPNDPALDPAVLVRLSQSGCVETERAVAKNPNTPLNCLHELWVKYPDCVLDHPLLTLWEIISPNEIDNLISYRVLLEVFNFFQARNEILPSPLFDHRKLGLIASIALDHRIPSIFKHFPVSKDPQFRKIFINAVQPHPNCCFFFEFAPDALWMSLANDPCMEVAAKFSQMLGKFDGNPARFIFAEAARVLILRKNKEIPHLIARSKHIPSETIDLLLDVGDVRTRVLLTEALYLSPAAQQRLVSDRAKEVRVAMAKSGTNGDVLKAFRMDDDVAVLKALLANKKTPHALRCQIVREASLKVQEILSDSITYLAPAFYFECKPYLTSVTRAGICKRAGLHKEIILDLIEDKDDAVRLALASNLKSKTHMHSRQFLGVILEKLLRDPLEAVRLEIIKNIELSNEQSLELLGDPSPAVRAIIAEDVLKKLKSLRHKNTLIRYEEFYGVFATCLNSMANDPEQNVRLVLANGEETPPQALCALLDSNDQLVAKKVAESNCLPLGYYIDHKIKISMRKRITKAFVKELAESPNSFLRLMAAKSSLTTIPELHKLAQDSHPMVAQTVKRKLMRRKYYQYRGVNPMRIQTEPKLAVA